MKSKFKIGSHIFNYKTWRFGVVRQIVERDGEKYYLLKGSDEEFSEVCFEDANEYIKLSEQCNLYCATEIDFLEEIGNTCGSIFDPRFDYCPDDFNIPCVAYCDEVSTAIDGSMCPSCWSESIRKEILEGGSI